MIAPVHTFSRISLSANQGLRISVNCHVRVLVKTLIGLGCRKRLDSPLQLHPKLYSRTLCRMGVSRFVVWSRAFGMTDTCNIMQSISISISWLLNVLFLVGYIVPHGCEKFLWSWCKFSLLYIMVEKLLLLLWCRFSFLQCIIETRQGKLWSISCVWAILFSWLY